MKLQMGQLNMQISVDMIRINRINLVSILHGIINPLLICVILIMFLNRLMQSGVCLST